MERNICISIVSHQQNSLVLLLLGDLEKFCAEMIEVIITINIPDKMVIKPENYIFPIKFIHNKTPKGFGENHNSAFRECALPYFCVLNPDIRLLNNPFPDLTHKFENDKIGVIGPAIINKIGQLQDSARKFLTISELFKRIILRKKEIYNVSQPDWVAGMFMLFNADAYRKVNGFDEAYYLYCEDMDICARLRHHHFKIFYDNTVKVIHSAQRHSHRNILYFIWHLKSLWRYFYLKRGRI